MGVTAGAHTARHPEFPSIGSRDLLPRQLIKQRLERTRLTSEVARRALAVVPKEPRNLSLANALSTLECRPVLEIC